MSDDQFHLFCGYEGYVLFNYFSYFSYNMFIWGPVYPSLLFLLTAFALLLGQVPRGNGSG